jgi:conjugative transfer pilus assembly protein TraH
MIKKISLHIFIFTLYFFLTLPLNVFANGVNGDLTNYFDSLGFSTNVTSPHAYNGQEAGLYTGGSLFARTPVRNVQLVQVELPSYRAGCGGIDIFTGGFSYVKYDDLVNLMQNIMNNSAGYAFTLAMETATPELANVMKYIHDAEAFINRQNINSCETAESLVGGAWPKTRATQQQICRDIGGSKGGLFDDWAQARQKCGVGSEFSSTMNRARSDPRYKNMVFDSGNIVWKVIKQNNLLNGDDELAEFFMSLSGTVIISKEGQGDDAPVNYLPLPGLMDKQTNNLIHALLKGGDVSIYKCDTTDENGCLMQQPNKTTKITILEDNAFGSRIKNLLDQMVDNVIDDKPLTKEQIGLLEATSLPVYKMLNVQVAYAKDKDTLDISSYADIIATDIIFQYLQETLRIIRENVASSQYPEEIIKAIQPNIDKELTELRAEQKNAYSRMAMTIQLIEKTQVIEKMLAGDLSSQLGSSLSWAKGLK